LYVKTPVAFVRARITEEDTCGRAGRKFVVSCGGLIRVTQTAENTESSIVRCGAIEAGVGYGKTDRLRWADIDEIGGRSNSFSPVRWGHRRLEKERAGDVVNGAYSTFGLAVLSRGIGARKAEADTMFGKKRGDGGVNELSTVVGLHSNKGPRKLCVHEGNKSDKCVGGVRFAPKRKGPHEVRKIIDNHEIVLKPRITQNRGCPKITMY
jgi:hypothetical protein